MNDHDRVTRWIAANRFPFPDQTDWPAAYVTITNESGPVRGIAVGDETHYPDILIVDGASQRIAEIGEVESGIPDDAVEKWSACSSACTQSNTGARSFFVYTPPEICDEAQRILESNRISYAGVRGFVVDGETVVITPVVTRGDAKDHR
jgi:hypothetical protein